MTAPTQHKRLRVRLKATDADGLARDFGALLRTDGLFLPCQQTLPPSTPVRLQLQYAGGSLALEGRGHVLRVEVRPMPGLDIEVEWTGASEALVAWCRARASSPEDAEGSASTTPIDPQSLISDLSAPDPAASSPAGTPFWDKDEPLGSETPGDDYGVALAADVLEDEPLSMIGEDQSAPQDGDSDGLATPPAVVDIEAATGWAPSEGATSWRSGDPGEWDDDSPPPASDDFNYPVHSPADGLEEDAFDEKVTVVAKSPAQPVDEPLIEPPVESVPVPEVVISTPVEGIRFESQGTTELADSSSLVGFNPPIPLATADILPDEPPKSVIQLDEVTGPNEVPLPPASVPRPPVSLQSPDEPAAREPGEVTPLARIALVRRRVDTQTGDVSDDVPSTAIPSKRNPPPAPHPSRFVMGVDLGTANTGMGIVVRGRPRLIPSRAGTQVIPSVVAIEPNGKTFVGEAASRKMPWKPKLGIAGPVRLLGRVAQGPTALSRRTETICDLTVGDDGEVAAVLGPHTVSVEELVALLLKEVRASVSAAMREPVNRAVLTCPSSFGARQRQALKLAAELAGLRVERIVSAPLAAAVEFAKDQPGSSRAMIVDCGAGALDVGLVEISQDGFRLVAARGSRELGGDAYDQLLVRHLASVTGGLKGASGLGGYFDIREAAELGKWTLSEQETAHIEIRHAGEDIPDSEAWGVSAEIRRADIEDIFEPLVSRTIELCKRACEEAGWSLDSIDAVLPVGGQARIPLLMARLRDVFTTALTVVDPHTTVTYGAARIAERIVDGRPLRLNEIVPQSIGIGQMYGGTSRVFSRGDPLPADAVHRFRVESEADLDLMLFEGEGDHVSQLEPLLRVSLTNVPAEVSMPFDVRMSAAMTDQGRLSVDAVIEFTGDDQPTETEVALQVLVRGNITPELVQSRLQLPAQPAGAGADESVFAWLLKRLAQAESARNAPLP